MLDVAQFSFNSQRSSFTGKTPFEIVYGRQPLMSHIVDHPYAGKSPQAHNITKEWKESSEVARARLEKALKRMKKWSDMKRIVLEFQLEDKVLIKLRPEQFRFRGQRNQRLVRKYEGPVEMIKKVRKASIEFSYPHG